jgi:hypothetical protein
MSFLIEKIYLKARIQIFQNHNKDLLIYLKLTFWKIKNQRWDYDWNSGRNSFHLLNWNLILFGPSSMEIILTPILSTKSSTTIITLLNVGNISASARGEANNSAYAGDGENDENLKVSSDKPTINYEIYRPNKCCTLSG